jgi:DNA-binding protein HU-beta
VNASDPVGELGIETGQACEWAVHNTAVLPSIHAQAGRSEGVCEKARHGSNRRSLNLNLRQLAAISGNLRAISGNLRHPFGLSPAPGRQSRRGEILAFVKVSGLSMCRATGRSATMCTMNKRDLAKSVAVQSDVELKTVITVLDGFTDVVTAVVSKGEPISIPGFAKFVKVDRAARMGRNPATGETIRIKASKKARITPVKAFKDAVLAPSTAPKLKKGAFPIIATAVASAGKSAPAAKAPAKKASAGKKAVRKAPAKKAAVARKSPVAKKAVRKAPAKKAGASR